LSGPSPVGGAWPSGTWRDVLVEAEEIGGVVLRLDRRQPLVVGTVGRAHEILLLLAEAGEVEVDAAATQGPHLAEEGARPGDVSLAGAGGGPGGREARQERVPAPGEGAAAGGLPPQRPPERPDVDRAVRRGAVGRVAH